MLEVLRKMQGQGQGIVQFFILWMLFFLGALIGSFISSIIVILYTGGDISASTNVLSQPYELIQITQFVSSLLMFVIPAILVAYLFNDNPKSYLKVQSPKSVVFFILTILFMVAILYPVSFTAYYNEKLVLPESMGLIERWMKTTAELNKQLMETLLANDSVAGIICNLFIIAVMAAISEELFFRGCLQQIMVKITKNIHAGIWITAIIFSAIHFDIYGFIPRVLLGAGLGYIFVWTGNLWYPIIAHFFNNATIVVMQQFYYKTPVLQENNFDWDTDVWFLIASVIGLIIIVYLFKRYQKKEVFTKIDSL